jgi:hypothetical protein
MATQSASLIDHVMVNDLSKRIDITHMPFRNLDHKPMFIEVYHTKYLTAKTPLTKISKTNVELVKQHLSDNEITENSLTDVNCATEFWTNEISRAVAVHTTENMVKPREEEYCSWIDNELTQVMRATQLWYRKLLKDPDSDALKREYTFWMEKLDELKYEKSKSYNVKSTEYSRASEIIEK